MNVKIAIDTESMSYDERERAAKDLRKLADIVDSMPAEYREGSETGGVPLVSHKESKSEGVPLVSHKESKSEGVPLVSHKRLKPHEIMDLRATISELIDKHNELANRVQDLETSKTPGSDAVRERTLADLIARIDKLEQRADKQVSEHCDLSKLLDSRMRERAESLHHDITTELGKRITVVHDITTDIGKRVTVVEDKVTNLAGAGKEPESTYRPGITPAPERSEMQAEIEFRVNEWRRKWNREFLVVSCEHYQSGAGFPKSRIHTSGDEFAGTELPWGGTVTKGLAGA